jgi:site-specific DNA recombinase
LAQNAQVASDRSTAAEPSLLAGLVVDETGRRLQPTHAKKGGKRYRYYIRPIAEGSSEERPLRIPATELEGLVVGEVLRWLRDEQRAFNRSAQGTASETHALIERGTSMAGLLESGSPAERTRILNELLVRVVVGAQTVEIVLRMGAPLTGIERAKGDVHSIVVPVALKRCGQAMRLIVQGPNAPKAREINPHLVALLAKSHRWFEALKSGQSPSIRSIAEAHGVESSDVTQAVYLAFLAPDIVERLVRGDHPEWLGVRRLLAMVPLPMEWLEQRQVLGLDG